MTKMYSNVKKHNFHVMNYMNVKLQYRWITNLAKRKKKSSEFELTAYTVHKIIQSSHEKSAFSGYNIY